MRTDNDTHKKETTTICQKKRTTPYFFVKSSARHTTHIHRNVQILYTHTYIYKSARRIKLVRKDVNKVFFVFS